MRVFIESRRKSLKRASARPAMAENEETAYAPAAPDAVTPGQSRAKRNTFSWILGAVLFLAVAASFCMRQSEVMAAKRRLANLEKEIQHYQSMNEVLLKQAETLRSNGYIEKTAREKLGLVKPGEFQYMLVTQTTK